MRNTFDQSWHPALPIVVSRSSSSDRHGAIYRLEPREIAGNWRIQLLAPKLLVFWRSRSTISLRRLAWQESIALNFSLNLIALHLNPTGCHEILAQAALIYVGYRETSRNRSLSFAILISLEIFISDSLCFLLAVMGCLSKTRIKYVKDFFLWCKREIYFLSSTNAFIYLFALRFIHNMYI